MAELPPDIIEQTDAEMLMRFVLHRDQDAFRQLVERHSELVLTVCRRILWHEQDVEDAFQATFLVLARRADAIRRRASVASWLFRIAQRTAARAALRRATRKEQPMEVEPDTSAEAFAGLAKREVFEVLAAELERLPRRYRDALILVYLESRSVDVAAEQLDCTAGVLKGRLARGRKLLRRRLQRRGLVLSIALASWFGASGSAEASLSPAVIDATVEAAAAFAFHGGAVAGDATAAQSLAEGVLSMKFLAMSKSMLVFATVALFCGGRGWRHRSPHGDCPICRVGRRRRCVGHPVRAGRRTGGGSWPERRH